MWNSSQTKVQGEGWGLLSSWQQQAHFAVFDCQKSCLKHWFIKQSPAKTLKAEPSKQAEPFLLRSQGQNTWRAHTCLSVGSVGVLGAHSSDQSKNSMGSWKKALPEGSQPLLYLNSLIWGAGKPKLMLGVSGSHYWEQQLAVTTHSTQICLLLFHFSCFHMDPFPKLWGREAVQVENVMSLVFILFL